MSITSMSARANMAQKLSIPQLQQAIQDGVVPAYVGIPLLQEKVKMVKAAETSRAGQMGEQPNIASQVMAEAQQVDQGVPSLATNLPAAMAGGGIVAFADGGMYDDEEDSYEDRIDAENQAEMDSLMDEYAKTFQGGIGQLPAAERAAPSSREGSAGVDNADFVSRIMQKESRGRRYGRDGELLTSEKGAKGEMQVMPGTSRDPGFGVTPARNDSPDELARVGRDYANTLLQRYGDPKLAAIAYNMGPGATDKWLAAGADFNKLPKETQGYVKGFAHGGPVRFQSRGLVEGEVDPELMNQIDIVGGQLDEARDEFKRMPAPGQRQMMSDPEALDRYQAAKARKEALELGYENIMNSAGIGQASFGNYRGALGTKKPEANPLVQAMSAQPAVSTEKKKIDKPKEDAKPSGSTPVVNARPQFDEETMRQHELAGERYMSEREAAANGTAAKEDVAKPLSKREQYEEALAASLMKREENLAKQREQDKYMALLQAGLGMMGGTSPNALANIGAGGMQGIQSLMQSNAARSAEENALTSGKLGLMKLGSAYEQAAEMRKLRADMQNNVLDQRKEQQKDASAARSERLSLADRKDLQDSLENRYAILSKNGMKAAESIFDPVKKKEFLDELDKKINQDKIYRSLHKARWGYMPGEEVGVSSTGAPSAIQSLLDKYSTK